MQKTTLLVLALILITNPSFAVLSGSAHDFGGCSICHSVHHAAGGGGAIFVKDPVYATDFYNSLTLDADVTLDSVNESDAPFCLTCHDGASITAGQNAALAPYIIGNLNIGTDLSNDHPIGFDYDLVAGLPGSELKPSGSLSNPDIVGFGPEFNQMWCSSCHDVHGGVPETPMLVMSNEGSALCLECHIK